MNVIRYRAKSATKLVSYILETANDMHYVVSDVYYCTSYYYNTTHRYTTKQRVGKYYHKYTFASVKIYLKIIKNSSPMCNRLRTTYLTFRPRPCSWPVK